MKLITLVLLALSLSLFSCKKDKPKHGIPPSEIVVEDLNETKTKVNAKFKNEKLDLLYHNYLAVKAALVNTDAQKTKEAAQKMNSAISSINDFDEARRVVVLIANEKDVEKQREFFVGLTDEVFKLVDGNIAEGKVFQQMCPMAFEGKGAVWLSDSNEIRNPYFGDVMLACGAVMKVFEN